MTVCYIGIGSNLGDRRAYIDSAIKALGASEGIKVTRVSSIYETDPVSDIPQGKFLNGVLEIETGLSASALFAQLQKIEKALGRERTVKNAPRTIDLDILYYGQSDIDDGNIVVPHPRIREREFVLRGLRELGKA